MHVGCTAQKIRCCAAQEYHTAVIRLGAAYIVGVAAISHRYYTGASGKHSNSKAGHRTRRYIVGTHSQVNSYTLPISREYTAIEIAAAMHCGNDTGICRKTGGRGDLQVSECNRDTAIAEQDLIIYIGGALNGEGSASIKALNV